MARIVRENKKPMTAPLSLVLSLRPSRRCACGACAKPRYSETTGLRLHKTPRMRHGLPGPRITHHHAHLNQRKVISWVLKSLRSCRYLPSKVVPGHTVTAQPRQPDKIRQTATITATKIPLDSRMYQNPIKLKSPSQVFNPTIINATATLFLHLHLPLSA